MSTWVRSLLVAPPAATGDVFLSLDGAAGIMGLVIAI
jgi:hypothetical protein